MKPPKKRQKLCQNCDGEVDLDVIFCPYCGADLLEEKQSGSDENSFERSGAKLYPPPYSPKKTIALNLDAEEPAEKTETEEKQAIPKNTFWATFLFTLGVQAFLMGLLLFIFSENGVVHLKFDAKMWLFYLVFSIPMLYFGWKAIAHLE
ncbi:MAG TPA: zinc ribbon domain-containing protein [Chlamydiales bacterium]|nr:zinc ribbon domain-containing protein [Chlamydiales bacterium]